MLYIKNAEIYTPHKAIKNGGVLIRDGKIGEIASSSRQGGTPRNDENVEAIDAKGKILCPGFIDVHLQGAGGYDFLDGTPQAIEGISRTLARFGTTSYLATTVFKNKNNPHIERIVEFQKWQGGGDKRKEGFKRINKDKEGIIRGDRGKEGEIRENKEKNWEIRENINGAQLLGIHLEGPFVNPKKKGMIRENGIKECSLKYLDKILDITQGKLKMMTIAPELSASPAEDGEGGSAMNSGRSSIGRKGALEIIKKLRKKKIIASFGHSDATYEETKKGINAGINHATHIFNAMRPIHHRGPGALPALLMDDNVSVQLISDGVHIHPAVIKLIVKLKGVKNIVLITDSMSSQGLADGRYVYDGWGYESRDGACRYKDGTLIGTALPLNKMVKRMVEFGGVSLLEAIQMATINPAKVLGINDKKGSIEAGKDADLVVMDKELNIVMTVVGGRIVYKKDKGLGRRIRRRLKPI